MAVASRSTYLGPVLNATARILLCSCPMSVTTVNSQRYPTFRLCRSAHLHEFGICVEWIEVELIGRRRFRWKGRRNIRKFPFLARRRYRRFLCRRLLLLLRICVGGSFLLLPPHHLRNLRPFILSLHLFVMCSQPRLKGKFAFTGQPV